MGESLVAHDRAVGVVVVGLLATSAWSRVTVGFQEPGRVTARGDSERSDVILFVGTNGIKVRPASFGLLSDPAGRGGLLAGLPREFGRVRQAKDAVRRRHVVRVGG